MAFTPGKARAQTGFDWRSDWSLRRGYAIEIDTEGYELPTSIAFVPRPGPGPKDPLYFITELRGTVKVITNDRSVFTFAKDFFTLRPIPAFTMANTVEVGLTGICLEPQRGYVFVTFAYHDARGVLRNNIVRFQSRPGTFSLAPQSSVDFRRIFLKDQSSVSHQIGPCQVHRDSLYVAVGDGGQPNRSGRLDSTLGKILRMMLDGQAAAGNPFFKASDPDAPAGYVWASGLRNPFGLTVVGERPFVVDNGNAIDRFVRVDKGEDYLWSGSDAGIGTKAIAVISQAVGVAGLTYTSGSPDGFPAGFYFNISGSPIALIRDRLPHVVHLGYSIADEKLVTPPEPLLRYRGSEVQVLAALAFGPGALYLVPLLPNRQGTSPVLRIVRDAAGKHPYVLEEERDPVRLLGEKGCIHCHSRRDVPNIGPTLDARRLVPRVMEKLASEGYREAVGRVDELDEEPYRSFRAARREVLTARGVDRVRLWIKYRILEPRFDAVESGMPNLGLTDDEATVLASFLVADYLRTTTTGARITQMLNRFIPAPLGKRHLLAVFVVGFVAGVGSTIILRVAGRRRGNRTGGARPGLK